MKFPTILYIKMPSHYLVKCITRQYYTVNNMFHAVLNDQQILLHFTDILNKQLVDMLLMMPQIVYATRLRSGCLIS